MQRMTRLFLLVALFALVAAACDGGETQDLTEDEAADETTEMTEGDGEVDDTDGDATVTTTDSEFGEILVDAEGMTLYMFEPDEGQGESTCTDECAEAWPPLSVEDEPTVGSALDESLLSTTERDDGTTQVVYNGHPLYYFAQDEAPGDTNGQGANDVWWVLSGPDGEPVEEAGENG